MDSNDSFLQAAIEEAKLGLAEGGIPIGSVIVHGDKIIGRGHNRRVQKGSSILHGEMDALENAGRQSAAVYRGCVLYTTLSPCSMCSGAILLYGIPRVIIGENKTFMGEEDLLPHPVVQAGGAAQRRQQRASLPAAGAGERGGAGGQSQAEKIATAQGTVSHGSGTSPGTSR